MFGFFKKVKEARAIQKELAAVFKARGHNFMQLHSTVHEALVKETLVRGVEATMQHFDYIVRMNSDLDTILYHYGKRIKEFD
jgi:hypothetical protein